ncbi:MAG: hypothetical protein LIO94_05650, partial [Clostridiales bacterium]|nr:hypothetical protein [Clostridiales bacterium]
MTCVQQDSDYTSAMSDISLGEQVDDMEILQGRILFLLEIFFEPDDTSVSKIILRLTDAAGVRSQLEGTCHETERKESKNELKRLLYRLLSEYSGKTLPWGNLTGIRPTKIPMTLLNQGWKNSEIAEYMRNTYYTSNEKTALAISIANREHYLLARVQLSPSPEQNEENGPAGQDCG